MENMKKCSACGRLLPITEFNKNKNSRDGYQDKCRKCFSDYNRKRYASNREKFKADVRRYREENPERCLMTRLKTCVKNPTHYNANKAVEAALKAGVIKNPQVCAGCGCRPPEHRIEAHHHDYSDPLNVVWLCTPCHREMDKRRRLHEQAIGSGSVSD